MVKVKTSAHEIFPIVPDLQEKFGIMLIKSDSADGDVAAVMKGAASATA